MTKKNNMRKVKKSSCVFKKITYGMKINTYVMKTNTYEMPPFMT
jgi:hypothetical protein